MQRVGIEVYRGSCHCQAVQFEFVGSPAGATRCNCSYCRRRGALMSALVPAAKLNLLSGADKLSLYEFGTGTAKHYFCAGCGVYTFHRTRKDPDRFRVNLGCLEGVDVHALEPGFRDGASD